MTLILKRIPHSLSEAVTILEAELNPQQRRDLLSMSRQRACQGLGALLKAEWRLWDAESPLVQWFGKQFQLRHSQDISSLLMEALWSRVQRLPARTDSLARGLRAQWEALGRDPVTMTEKSPLNDTLPLPPSPPRELVH